MVFEVKNKVAIVTGGAAGIGLALVKNLLQLGAKGVTIADFDVETGEKIVRELQKEFGSHRVIFVSTDVVNYESFELAFKLTLEQFKNIDIIFNNAGFGSEVEYDREIDVNVKGVANGMLLGIEKYLKDHKSGQEAVIVNTSSTTSIEGTPACPMYTATKFAVTGMTVSWGDPFYYDTSKVRVFAICPGYTDTGMPKTGTARIRTGAMKAWDEYITRLTPTKQSPVFLAAEVMKLLKTAPNGSIWIIENTQPAYQYFLQDKNVFKPK